MVETATLARPPVEASPILRPTRGEAYAWGKTARVLSEPHHDLALASTEGDFVVVDLCSSYPIYAQMQRDRHMMRCREQAKLETGQLIRSLDSLPSFARLSGEKKRELRQVIAPKDGLVRRFLISALQQIYYLHPINENMSESEKEDSLRYFLTDALNNDSEVFDTVREIPHLEGRGGNWLKLIPFDVETTLYDELEKIVGGDSGNLTRDIVRYLLENATGNMRKYAVISVDLKPASQLRKKAEKSFPYDFKNSQFFRDASFFDDHLRTDLSLGLSFRPNSVSLFTSFEGWPFYFSSITGDQEVEFAQTLAESLKPGGRAVFFPWGFDAGGASEVARLITLEGYFNNFGLRITLDDHKKSELEEQMSDRELVLLKRSPVFDEERGEKLTNLILEKPVETDLI